MKVLLDVLRRWRIIRIETRMEVAVTQDGLLRLRPVVYCDRDCSEWVREVVL